MTVTGAGTARPSIAWSGTAASADAVRVAVSSVSSDRVIFDEPDEVQEIDVPALPNALATMRPTILSDVSVGFYEANWVNGYADVKAGVDDELPEGDARVEINGTVVRFE